MLSCNGQWNYVGVGTKTVRKIETPVDELIDLAARGVSLAVREMCCRIATDSGSFASGGESTVWAQLKLRRGCVNWLSQADGAGVATSAVGFDFDARHA
jgi:hypothetical protein